jgi:hypothetical protein
MWWTSPRTGLERLRKVECATGAGTCNAALDDCQDRVAVAVTD